MKNSLNALKRMVTLTTVCGVLLCFMGMTAQEAQVAYTDLDCEITTFNADGIPMCAKCNNLTALIVNYQPSWEDGYEPPPVDPPPIDPPPSDPPCVATWCGLPLQECSLPPRTDGTDSCGGPCSKPSPEWPNCKMNGETIAMDFL